MARNRRRSRSSRSKSPSVSLDPRPDDLEAQMSAIDSSNTGNKQEAASVVSRMSSAHRASDDVSPNPLFGGAPSPANLVLGDLKPQSRTRGVRPVNDGDPLQAANPADIPLPPSVENLSQLGSDDGESASTGSGPNTAAQVNVDNPLSGNVSSRSNAIDEDCGSARNEHAASQTRPRSLDVPPAGQKNEDKSEPGGETSDPWTKCATAVWQYETNRVEKWKEDINNLLLFSGLFSTVLTGFIVQYYVMLSMQQPDASAQALVHISSQLVAMSGQLNAFMSGAVHLNVTQPIIPSAAILSPVPRTSHTTISTCTLWFMALVCSLGAASIGITVSQWLQHHGDKTTSTSRQSVSIWYFRDQGFVDWGVQDIINILPLLLQLSVALFLVGLVQLLFTMNVVVASIMTVLASALLAFSMVTALIPAFAPKCPYKSPQAWWCLLILRWLTRHLEHHSLVKKHFGETPLDQFDFFDTQGRYVSKEYLIRRIWHSASLRLTGRSFHASMPTFSGWRDLEYFLVRAQAEKTEEKLKMMVHADEILTDETSLPDIISPCVTESDLAAALPAFYAIMQRRAHETKPSDGQDQPELIWYRVDSDGQLVLALGDMAVNMFARVTNADGYYENREAEQLHILKILDELLDAMPETQPGAAVYLRLCALADLARLSADVQKKLAELIVANYYLFWDEIKDIRPMLSAISSCQDLDPAKFSYRVADILYHSAKLPQAEFEGIHDELRGALAAVAEYFGQLHAAALADRLTRDGFSWYSFARFSNACVELAKVDKGLFSPEIIDALEQFSSLCPDDDILKRYIPDTMKTLREVTGLPAHPEVIPAANSQSSSAADS